MKYPAAERITWNEWLVLGLLLAGLVAGPVMIIGAIVIWVQRILRGE